MRKKTDEALKKLAFAYGGIQNFHSERADLAEEAKNAWSSDVLSIGRILRAHLYVEYYLNKYLTQKCLIKKSEVESFTFFQKIEYIEKRKDSIRELASSIKRINRTRNMMSHNLNWALGEKDSNYFKSRKFFQNYYSLAKTSIDEGNPVEVYELYCHFIANKICEKLNPKQYLLDNVMKALAKDVVDAYDSPT